MVIDHEFEEMLPPCDDTDTKQLREDIKKRGILDPLKVWDETDILVDGHRRLAIANDLGIDAPVSRISFESREDAADWIDRNQLQRRNLNPHWISLVRGRRYNRLKKPHGGQIPGSSKGDVENTSRSNRTAHKIAEDHGVCASVVAKDSKFASAVETLKPTVPDIEARVAAGKIPSRKAVIEAAKKPPAKRKPDELDAPRTTRRQPRKPAAERVARIVNSLEGVAIALDGFTDDDIASLDPIETVNLLKPVVRRLSAAARRLWRER